jgi:hypothetical protein
MPNMAGVSRCTVEKAAIEHNATTNACGNDHC